MRPHTTCTIGWRGPSTRGRWGYIARLVLIDGTTEMVTYECGEQIAARFRGVA
jgi:hypothetical protein